MEYKDEKEAEEAMNELQEKNMGGLKITIEWSKKSTKYDPKDSRRPPRQASQTANPAPRKDMSEVKCYACNKHGHFARDCPERR